MIKDIKHNSDTVVTKIILFKNGKAKKKRKSKDIMNIGWRNILYSVVQISRGHLMSYEKAPTRVK